jgi:hypothetical protein
MVAVFGWVVGMVGMVTVLRVAVIPSWLVATIPVIRSGQVSGVALFGKPTYCRYSCYQQEQAQVGTRHGTSCKGTVTTYETAVRCTFLTGVCSFGMDFGQERITTKRGSMQYEKK